MAIKTIEELRRLQQRFEHDFPNYGKTPLQIAQERVKRLRRKLHNFSPEDEMREELAKVKVLIVADDGMESGRMHTLLSAAGVRDVNISATNILYSVEAHQRFSPNIVISSEHFYKIANISWDKALAPLFKHVVDARAIIVTRERLAQNRKPESYIVDAGSYALIPFEALKKDPKILETALLRMAV
jgi:hypothetical protein